MNVFPFYLEKSMSGLTVQNAISDARKIVSKGRALQIPNEAQFLKSQRLTLTAEVTLIKYNEIKNAWVKQAGIN
jgi:hypothetical protein